MKLLLVFVVCIVPLVTARTFGGRATDSCIADFLTSRRLMKEGLGSGQDPNQECLAIVEITKRNIIEGVQQQLLSDKSMRDDSKCITNHLRKSDFGNYLLMTFVYESSTKMDEEEKRLHLKKTESKIAKLTFDSFMVCQAEKKFSKLFEDLFQEDSTEEELGPHEDYCFRKHIVQNNLITVEGVELDLNPKGIDISGIDCSTIYPKALKEAVDELVKAITEENSSEEEVVKMDASVPCVKAVILENKFIDQMLPFDYVKEYTLNHEQKESLRKNFVVVMGKVAEKTSKCFL
jgi:hypothetical protein